MFVLMVKFLAAVVLQEHHIRMDTFAIVVITDKKKNLDASVHNLRERMCYENVRKSEHSRINDNSNSSKSFIIAKKLAMMVDSI